MRRLFLIAATFALLLCSAAFAASSSDTAAYVLGVGDQVRLRVFDWRQSIGDVHQWTALDGQYRIGADGTASLPLLGTIKASGLTTEQLAAEVSEKLQGIVGQTIQPRASIEVIEYRPFFILGDVNKPGAYPYRPGLTVLEAIGIAGGTFRTDDQALLLTTARDLDVLRLQYLGLLARRARLEAELSGATSVTFPPELVRRQNEPTVAQLIQREEAMFAADRDAYASELDTLVRLKALLSGEIAQLDAKTRTVDQEVSLTRRELDSTAQLVRRGLAIAPREFSERQMELQTEGRRLDLSTAQLRAKEDIGKAEQAIVELRNKTRGNLQTEIASVERKSSEVVASIASDSAIVGRGVQRTDGTPAPIRCLITRRGATGTKVIEANESTPVEPGDAVQVLRPSENPIQSASGPAAEDPPPPPATPALVPGRRPAPRK